MRRRIVLIGFLVAAVCAPAIEPPRELFAEAPASLLELDILDADVRLIASGSWSLAIGTSLALAITSDRLGSRVTTGAHLFPGLQPTPLRSSVDLTLSLWLLDRYFFEASFSDEFSAAAILLGYAGRPDEFVQSVLIGTSGIEMPAYPYLGFGADAPGGAERVPGVAASFQTAASTHDLMLRYESVEEELIVYDAGGVVTEARVRAVDYERNRHFVLPDRALDSLEVYVEDRSGSLLAGDDHRYRTVDPGRETRFSLSDGLVSFRTPPATRVLVYYESGGLPIGDPALGTDAYYGWADGVPDPEDPRRFAFTGTDLDEFLALLSAASGATLGVEDVRVSIGGRDAFVLHEPGRYSPFASAAWYAAADQAPGASFVVEGRSLAADSFRLTPEPGLGAVLVARPGADERGFAGRYPFADPALPALTDRIYGPAPDERTPAPQIVQRRVTPTASIALPATLVPGSLRVVRNGRSDPSASVGPGGALLLDPPLSPVDRVEVRFRTAGGQDGGNLLAGAGSTFALSPRVTLQTALGLRWQPWSGAYSERAGEHPGYLVASAGVTLGDDPERPNGSLRAAATAAASFGTPDTSGALRVAGMNDRGVTLPAAPSLLFPAPAPVQDPGIYADAVDPATRGVLRYVDHAVRDLAGNVSYLDYLLRPPDVELYDYGPDGRTGPYPARSFDAGYEGPVAVLEYRLDPERTWAGAVIRVPGGQVDLSAASTLVVPYRLPSGGDGVQIVLEIGRIGEDLDGDGVLDSGYGFLEFRDATGTQIPAGSIAPAGTRYTEDANANGVLDPELPELIVRRVLDPAGSTGWQTATVTLSREERRRLASVSAVRILVIRDDVGTIDGRLVIGDIVAQGTDFAVAHPPAAAVTARSLPAKVPLATAFPAAAAKLSGRDGVDNVLEIAWTGLSEGAIELYRPVVVPAAHYAVARVYARRAASSAPVDVRLSAWTETTRLASRTGTLFPGDTGWIDLDLALPESDAHITGFTVEISGSPDGTLELDELSLWEPRSSFGAVAEGEVVWSPGFALRAGDWTIVDRVTVTGRLAARTEGFVDGLSPVRVGIEGSTAVDARIAGALTSYGVTWTAARSAAETDAAAPGAPITGVGFEHGLTAGLGPRVELTERYISRFGALGAWDRHLLELAAAAPPWRSTLGWRADRETDSIRAWSFDAERRSGGSGGVPALDPGFSVELAARERSAEPFTGAYPRTWIDSFALLVPTSTSAIERSYRLSLAALIPPAPLGLRTRLAFDGRVAGAGAALSPSSERSSVSGTVGVPVTLAAGVTLEVSYSRRAEAERSGDPSSLGEDAAGLFALLVDHPFTLAPPPLLELWSSAYEADFSERSEGLRRAAYTPGAALTVARPIVSSPWSLVVPTRLELEYSRPAERLDGAVRSASRASGRATLIAVNLFGALGTASRFSGYDTDEYTTSVTTAISDDRLRGWNVEFDLESRSSFRRRDRRRMDVTSTLSLGTDEPAAARLAATLGRPAAESFVDSIPLPAVLRALAPSATHEESLEINRTVRPETAAALASRELTVIVGHATEVSFSSRGAIRFRAGAGVGWRSDGDADRTRTFLTGLEIGVSGRLRL